ncbi:hypothetical protein G9A89_014336 [Geosiphon pyriformis]|nr:hypothetical protein G9A89_014336 [Geosiphon pyriformis]
MMSWLTISLTVLYSSLFTLSSIITNTSASPISNAALIYDGNSSTRLDMNNTNTLDEAQDADYSIIGAKWLFGISFAIMQLNAIGSIYVIYRTFSKWYGQDGYRKTLSMALRVPFYIAISDFCLYIAHMFNQSYTVLNETTWPGFSCKVVGGTVFYLVAVNMTLVGFIALATYLRVCRRILIDLGRFDCNLFLIVLGFPLILTLCSIPSFGPSTYWCYTNKTNHIMPLITLILNFSIIALNIFCYFFTLREINTSGNRLANVRSKDNPGLAANIEQRVTRKVAAYVLIFTIQWTPAMPYVVASVVSNSTPSVALYLLCDVAINLGGIGNCIQYVLNEGWKHRNEESTDDTEISSKKMNSINSRQKNQIGTISSFSAIQTRSDEYDLQDWNLPSPPPLVVEHY